jgi:hypothetical protein
MKYLPYNKPSYFLDSTTSHELLSSNPPAAKNGVSPKILRNELKSTAPRPHESRKLCFSLSL